MLFRKWLIAAAIGVFLAGPQGSRAFAQDPGFYPADVAPGGVVTVNGKDTYYDASDGVLSAEIPLPTGATKIEFRVTGVEGRHCQCARSSLLHPVDHWGPPRYH